MVEKHFISADELLRDSYRLGHMILESGFKPNYIIGIWRGGTPVGIAVQELLDFHGVATDHIAIRTSSYDGIEKRRESVQVHGLHYIIENVNAGDHLLIIDDVFDSGHSVKAVIAAIQRLS
ncbi:MAG: hypoxanthine phosphoribosyltransferase, partial [Alphaproteobacteria bacterium]|nr:hypoxanthine phosphoribosyltransferase [Alphaproteobacteria bacterium]